MRKETILRALRALPVENVTNEVFFWVGKVLKKEGLPCSVWDDWAKNDKRYRPGLCGVWWEKFRDEDCRIDGRYVVRLAQLSGRLPPEVSLGPLHPEEEPEGTVSESETAAREDAPAAEAALSALIRAADREEEEEELDFDGLPYLTALDDFSRPPALPEELIGGVLRRGHKMLLAGPSKAGKSFLLMQLCVAVAEGVPWLGQPCRQGRVLYVNLEIDKASVVHRFFAIYKAMGLPQANRRNIEMWNLRGCSLPMDQLAWPLIRRTQEGRFDLVVIDPVYKVLTGDENSAAEMAAFCNQFDMICCRTGCSLVYCHHHSKGAQGQKKSIDRASGSGVFSRDADAQMDIIELELTPEQRRAAAPGATGWRMESSLREFAGLPPVHFWYEYPLHRLDEEGVLSEAAPEGDGRRRTTPAKRTELLGKAFAACEPEGTVKVDALARHAGVSRRTMVDWLKENAVRYRVTGETVTRREGG